MAASARRRKSRRPRTILAGLGWAPFRPSSDAQLYPIRIMELTKQMFQVEADESLSAEDKAAKLKELDRREGRVRGPDGQGSAGLAPTQSPGGAASGAARRSLPPRP